MGTAEDRVKGDEVISKRERPLADGELNTPLAHTVRPTDFSTFFGQEHIFSKGSVLSRVLEEGALPVSLIFSGPSGSGKSTLAYLIANKINGVLVSINATTSSTAEVRSIIKEALSNISTPTILLIDEIHRFNKTQQDSLLKACEEGVLRIIGTTTENPYFAVNKALLSRCSVLLFKPLSSKDLLAILQRVVKLKRPDNELSEELLLVIANNSGGDARRAINTLQYLLLQEGELTKNDITKLTDELRVTYDKDGNEHYNLISAIIKSIRGSDPDSSILYLSTALAGGMDPLYIARRLIILASEDIGLADPSALTSALNAFRACEILGMPESRYALAQATIHLSLAYKSNSVSRALDKVESIKSRNELRIPNQIRDTHYAGAEEMGAVGYKYPHDYPDAIVDQDYWPENIDRVELYNPSNRGNEARITEILGKIRNRLIRPRSQQ